MNMPDEIISQITGLSMEEIEIVMFRICSSRQKSTSSMTLEVLLSLRLLTYLMLRIE